MFEQAQERSAGGPSQPAIENHILGVAIFTVSESLFFIPLIVIYLIYRNQNVEGPDAKQALDVGRTAIFTVSLLASSVTIYLASRRLAKGDEAGMRRFLLLTMLLGAVFLVGQGIEYRSLLDRQIDLSRNLFGSTFFTLTGFHGLHVFLGLVAMLALAASAYAGDLTGKRTSVALETISIYWHFVDAVWVVIFTSVYLWTLIQ